MWCHCGHRFSVKNDKGMKFLIITIFATIVCITPSFVYAENTLQNTNLVGESAVILLDIEFGGDTIKSGFTRDYITNHLDVITLTFYGDEIPLSEPELKITSTGDNFRILSLPEGIIIYGHKKTALENYEINLYFSTDKDLNKFTLSSSIPIPKEQVIESIQDEDIIETEFHFLTDQYERVYNTYNYKFFVKTFDKSLYFGNEWNNFEGRISGATVTAIISDPDGVIKSDTTGIVEYGIYEGTVHVPHNLWKKGWYTIDLQIEFEGKLYYEQLSFYVYGHPPIHDSKP